MLWKHPDHEKRRIRLAYCLNLHAAEDFDELLHGMREITLPLAERLAPDRASGREFGVGLYLAGPLAHELSVTSGRARLVSLIEFLREHHLDPFTFNAFPQGGFHSDSLKREVFQPTWKTAERLDYTLAVARVACALHGQLGRTGPISISTHTGMFGALVETHDDLYDCAVNFTRFARTMRQVEDAGGPRVILSLEAEPRANCGDTAALRAFLEDVYLWGGEWLAAEERWETARGRRTLERYVGCCLDACHSAVEFELADLALREATAAGGPLGKLQFSNALRLEDPLHNERGRATLFALDEPRYLHQVTGAHDPTDPMEARTKVEDLPELQHLLASDDPARTDWERCSEWRCHFHVPVDLEHLGEHSGLATTRAQSDRLLDLALTVPSLWNTDELHLEIETYTWDVLPGPARGTGDLIAGLEREYRHTLARLEAAGWHRARP